MSIGPQPTITLRPSKLRCTGLAVGSGFAAVVMFYLWFGGTENVWIPGSFMAVAAAFFFMHLVPNAYALWIDAQGFKVSEMFSVKRYEWPEISDFAVRRGVIGHYVAFHHLSPNLKRPKKVILHENYGYKPVDLARLLNQHRRQALIEKKTEPARQGNVWRSFKR